MLALLSGGFDSPVASWMLMRRGAPVDVVHFRMECAQSEHAAAVAHELRQRWGAGSQPDLWQIDFQEVTQHLIVSSSQMIEIEPEGLAQLTLRRDIPDPYHP